MFIMLCVLAVLISSVLIAVPVSSEAQVSEEPFVTTWQTTKANESIRIPVGGTTGTYTVDWGDGNVSANVTGDQTHSYGDAGTYTVSISGDFTRIHLNTDMANAEKLRSIEQWGDMQWESMNMAFTSARNMAYHATDVPDLSSVTDMSGMFWFALSFDGDLSGWNVSSVTDMSRMFWHADSFNSDLSGWDVSSVTDMHDMFRGALVFNSDLSGWDVSSVTDMRDMFEGSHFTRNLGSWYIVLNDTSIEMNDAPGVVGSITAQNPFLDGQNPVYRIGSGGDSDSFEINGTDLILKTQAAKNNYSVNVTSGGGFGTGHSRMIDASVANYAEVPPVISAGADSTVTGGHTAALSGTAIDANGNVLTYLWTHNSSLPITVLDADTLSPSFTAPAVDADAAVTFTLTVGDGTSTVSDQVTITITYNHLPVVSAGSDQTVLEGDPGTLFGSAVDANGDPLTYLWTHNSSLAITLDNSTSLSANFTAPAVDADADVIFTLTATDLHDATIAASDHATITIANDDPPAISAGSDQTVQAGDAVTLPGTATDEEGDALTYSWTQTSGLPLIVLSGADTLSPSFTAPAALSGATLVFELSVSDGSSQVTDTVTVTVDGATDGADFITTWQTTSAGESITIPVGGAAGTYTVNWGDGTLSEDVSGDQTHAYDAAGTHAVGISGDFTKILLSDSVSNARKLQSIEQWGDMQWESMNHAFRDASNMAYHATDAPDLSSVTDMSQMFRRAASFNGDLSGWDVSSVVYMSQMFRQAASFNGDLSGWDVSSVTAMPNMFAGASAFNQNLGNWYVVLDDTTLEYDDPTGIVGSISAQNPFLGGQNPVYHIGQSRDSGSFEINGTDLVLKTGAAKMAGYSVRITSDGDFGTDNSRVFDISVTNYVNTPPDVNAGTDLAVLGGHTAVLSGNATDINADPLTYLWTHNSSLPITILDADTLAPSFTAPAVDADTAVTFTLTVDDDTATASDSASITIIPNNPPDAGAGSDQTVQAGDTVTLSGTATDEYGDTLTYSWTQTSGLPLIVLSGADTLSPSFTAPAALSGATLVFELSVSDVSSQVTDTVTVTVDGATDGADFITTWQTTSAGESITMPVGGAAGTYTVNWGDGTLSEDVSGDQTHAYDAAGTHAVGISGDFTKIFLSDSSSNAQKLQSIEQWGDMQWESMNHAFRGASNMAYHATDAPDLSSVTDMSQMFRQAASFDGNLSGWNVSSVTNMSELFSLASSFDGDLSTWDVSSVADMSQMFRLASSFDGDLSTWDVSSVADMSQMFFGSSFNGDLSGWNVSSVTAMPNMFTAASAFNQNLGNWYVVLDDTTLEYDDPTGIVGSISAQNQFLDGQNPAYRIGSGDDSDSFEISGTDLVLKAGVAKKAVYSVHIISDRGFGTDNSRVFDISVTNYVNTPPDVNAGTDLAVLGGHTAVLSGNATDINADPLTYLWTHNSSLPITILDADTLAPSFTAPAVDADAAVTFTLTVDDDTATVSDHVIATIAYNDPPLVDAGHVQTVKEGSSVTLSGTVTDTRADLLTYLWTHNSSLTIEFANSTQLSTSFTAPAVDADANVTFMLTVRDGPNTVTDHTTVTITLDDLPTVIAGPDQKVEEGDSVTLSGTVINNDDDHLTYEWTHNSDLTISLSNPAALNTTFTAPAVGEDADVTFTLTVSDGPHTVTDHTVVSINHNDPPSVDAGLAQTADEGSTVTLSGTATDDDGDQLTYLWTHDSSLTIEFANSTHLSTSFTAPAVDADANVTFTLTVRDGPNTVTDNVIVTIENNDPPSVDAGLAQTADEGSTVTLSGTATDDDGDQLTYLWTHDSSLTIEFANSTHLSTSFTAPAVDADANVTFTLTVGDGPNTVTDNVIVTIENNDPPSVDAGLAQTADEGSTVTLSGTATDDDGDQLTYLWTHDSSLTIEFANSTHLSTSFTAPAVDADANVTFTLTVGDGPNTVTDNVIVTIENNDPPSIDAGSDQTVQEGDTVTLNGTATDGDGDQLTYSWTQISGLPLITLFGADTLSPSFTAPATLSGITLVFELSVSDGSNESTDTVTATVTSSTAGTSFITTWQTTSAGESITMPVDGATGTYTVDWGDGTLSEDVSGDQTHTYVAAGTYTVSISGDFTKIFLSDSSSNARKLQSIEQWGDIQWEAMNKAFKGASNMAYRATDAPDLSSVTDMSNMFFGAASFNGDLSNWDVSSVTDMSAMFFQARSFNGDLSNWDVSSVIRMGLMFFFAPSFDQNLGNWYIVLDDAAIEYGDSAGIVGSISAQNPVLDGQNPVYSIGSGGDSSSFEIDGTSLVLKTPQIRPAGNTYVVEILSTGDFGTDNSRMINITMTDPVSITLSVDAGLGQTVRAGDTVTLSGVADDEEDDQLTYLWTHDSSLTIEFANSTQMSTSFTAPVVDAGTDITFTLTVSDGTNTVTDNTVVTINPNNPPSVDAGSDQTVKEMNPVTLSGTATDNDDNNLTYLWTDDSYFSIQLSNATSLSPTFTAPAVNAGTDITFTLTVSDGTNTVTDNTVVTINPNNPPSVDAGSVQTVQEGDTVTLHGAATDDDSDQMTYEWIYYSTLDLDLANATSLSPTFTAPAVDADIDITFVLIVNDGIDTVTDSTVVSINHNDTPYVNAYSDRTAQAGETVTLSGTATDDDGDQLTYLWTHDSSLTIEFANSTHLSTSFTAPAVDADTDVTFTLTVSDGTNTVDASTVVTINPDDAPSVGAGSDQTVQAGETVTLSGTATDDDSTRLTYAWTHDSDLAITLSDSDTLTATFTAPAVDADTDVTFTLTVSDGTNTVDASTVVTINPDDAPSVGAGSDQTVQAGETVTLSGTATDDDSTRLTYAWTHDSDLAITLSDSDTLTATFTAPAVDADTDVTFTLTVSDGPNTVTDQIIITVNYDGPPIISAGSDQTVEEGSLVTLSGTATDPEGDFMTYSWTQTSGLPPVTLSGADTLSPSFMAPATLSSLTLVFELSVGDDSSQVTDTVTVTIDSADTGANFITTWQTTSTNESITVPAIGTYTIDWGDGITDKGVVDSPTHTYAVADTYVVVISGDLESIDLGSSTSNAAKLQSIEQWGDIEWTDMSRAFDGAVNMTYNAVDSPDLSGVTIMNQMFRNAASFNGDLSGWDVSPVTGMNSMFQGASSFNGNISGWDVSPVTGMISMFQDASSFNQDVSEWNVSSVVNMEDMFHDASSFNQDVSEWNVSNVSLMFNVFSGASSFDQNLGKWYVTLDSTGIDLDVSGDTIGTISAQNSFLDGQVEYGIGLGGNPDLFLINSASKTLELNPYVNHSGGTYQVNITSTGFFGTDSHRMVDVIMTGSRDALPPPPIATANAGPDQIVNEEDLVTLSGLATYSGNGTITYAWTHDSDLAITLSDSAALTATFSAPAVTSDTNVTFTLTVTDGPNTVADNVIVTIENNDPPSIDAGTDQTVLEGATVTLAGTATDDGSSLTYGWTHDSDLAITLSDSAALTATFSAPAVDADTEVTFTLTVTDGPNTVTDNVIVTIENNDPPTVSAGTDQTVLEGATVTLAGTATDDGSSLTYGWTHDSDLAITLSDSAALTATFSAPAVTPSPTTAGTATDDGSSLTYGWTHDSDLAITLSDSAALTATFSAPAVTSDTNVTFTLTVTDGPNTVADNVIVTIENNDPPSIDAGTDQTVLEGATVTLAGTATDDGSSLTYGWTHDSDLAITLSDSAALTATFSAPAVTSDTNVTFTLTVTDGPNTVADNVIVTIENNDPPSIDAGTDQTVLEGATVTLAGTATDDGSSLTYGWTHDSDLAITLSDSAALTATFSAPAVTSDTNVTFTLTVTDGPNTVADNVIVTIENNDPPSSMQAPTRPSWRVPPSPWQEQPLMTAVP